MRKIKPHLIRSDLIVARKHRTLEHAKQVKEIEKHNQEEIKKIADQVGESDEKGGDNKKDDKTDKKDNKDGEKVVKVSKSDEQKGKGEEDGPGELDVGTTNIERGGLVV